MNTMKNIINMCLWHNKIKEKTSLKAKISVGRRFLEQNFDQKYKMEGDYTDS